MVRPLLTMVSASESCDAFSELFDLDWLMSDGCSPPTLKWVDSGLVRSLLRRVGASEESEEMSIVSISIEPGVVEFNSQGGNSDV